MSAWILFALALIASFVAAYFYLLAPLGLTDFITPSSLASVVGASAVVAMLGYWLATLIAASPVMRPSVPFSFTPVR